VNGTASFARRRSRRNRTLHAVSFPGKVHNPFVEASEGTAWTISRPPARVNDEPDRPVMRKAGTA
jgi:hypothetical protein